MSLLIPPLSRSYADNPDFLLETKGLQVPDDGFTCVIGVNGSGKSSFGEALAQQKEHEPWFYLPQFIDRFLFAENIKEQIATFLSGSVQEDRLRSILEDMGFSDPDSIMTFPFILMSGGERRRVALASVFYMSPENIVLDEPEIGVTAKENMVLLTKIRNLKAIDTRVILISHTYDLVRESSALICLENGRIDRFGRTEKLLNDPDFDLSMYGVRFGTGIEQ